MKTQNLKKVMTLAEKTGFVFIATADTEAVPHLAAAGKLDLTCDDCLELTEWFCPGTVANLQHNRAISIVVWDKPSDTGYQLIGRVEKIDDMGVLDGYAPGLDTAPPLPQVRRRLLIRTERIIDFKLAPHSDVEE